MLMMRSLALLMLAFTLPVYAQQVDFSALVRYGDACVKLKAAILTDAGKALGKDEHVIDWISECNGNIPACRDAGGRHTRGEEGVAARLPGPRAVARSGIRGVFAVSGESVGAAAVYRKSVLTKVGWPAPDKQACRATLWWRPYGNNTLNVPACFGW